MEQKINLRGDQYNLKWNNFSTNLLDVIREKQLYEALTDVTIFCEGRYIRAHKIVLSASSLVFEEMFSQHVVEHPFIVLNGVNYKDLKYIIEFIYNGEIKVYDCDLQGVLNVGENLKVKGLSSVKVKETKPPSPLDLTHEAKVNSQQAKQPVPEMYVDKEYLEKLAHNTDTKKGKEKAKEVVRSPKVNNESTPPKKRKFTEKILKEMEQPKINNEKTSKAENHKENPKQIVNDKPPQLAKLSPNKGVKVEKLSEEKHSSTFRLNIVEKIPRPPNAFMLFASDMRKKVSLEHPNESNKSISIILGNMWKTLSDKDRENYCSQAKEADAVHKTKYPNYYYSPKEARLRKAATSLGKGIVNDSTLELVNYVVNETKHDSHIEIELQDEDESVETIDITEEPPEVPVIHEQNT